MDPEVNQSHYWRNYIVKAKLELYMIHQREDVRSSTVCFVVIFFFALIMRPVRGKFCQKNYNYRRYDRKQVM